jgi:hypothetical protein
LTIWIHIIQVHKRTKHEHQEGIGGEALITIVSTCSSIGQKETKMLHPNS